MTSRGWVMRHCHEDLRQDVGGLAHTACLALIHQKMRIIT